MMCNCGSMEGDGDDDGDNVDDGDDDEREFDPSCEKGCVVPVLSIDERSIVVLTTSLSCL